MSSVELNLLANLSRLIVTAAILVGTFDSSSGPDSLSRCVDVSNVLTSSIWVHELQPVKERTQLKIELFPTPPWHFGRLWLMNPDKLKRTS